MALYYKINVLERLKGAGYSTYRLRKDKIMGESVVQQLRKGEIVSWATIDTICNLLHCQPGDIIGQRQEHEKEVIL